MTISAKDINTFLILLIPITFVVVAGTIFGKHYWDLLIGEEFDIPKKEMIKYGIIVFLILNVCSILSIILI